MAEVNTSLLNAPQQQAPQSASDVLGPDPNTQPSASSVLGPEPEDSPSLFKQAETYSGQLADSVFGGYSDYLSRSLNYIGQGVQQGWGSKTDPGFESLLRDHGIINDYKKGNETLSKSINEAWMRPIAAGLDLGWRATKAAASGTAALLGTDIGAIADVTEATGEGLGATGEAIDRLNAPNALKPTQQTAATIVGGTGEILSGVAHGFFADFPEAHGVSIDDMAEARAKGQLGEGEKGYFNTSEVSPENIQARTEAAKDAGLTEVPPIQPPLTDPHAVARLMNPDLFNQWDTLHEQISNLRDSLPYLRSQRLEELQRENVIIRSRSSNALTDEASQQLTNAGFIPSGVDESAADRMTQVDADRIANNEALIEKTKISDTPEMAGVRQRILETDQKLRDLIPDISDVKNRAEEYLDSQTPEGAAFRDYVQAKALETATRLQDLEPQVRETIQNAQSLIEEPKETASGSPVQGQEKAPVGTTTAGSGKPVSDAPRAPGKDQPLAPPVGPKGEVTSAEETAVSQLSQKIEASAIRNGMTESFGDLPEHQVMNLQGQFDRAADFINNDYKGAIEAFKGNEPLPSDIHPTVLAVGLEKAATSIGDIKTLKELATNPGLIGRITDEARSLRILKERESYSPVEAMSNITKAREEVTTKGRGVLKEVENIYRQMQEFVKNNTPPPQAKIDELTKFFNDIRCKP